MKTTLTKVSTAVDKTVSPVGHLYPSPWRETRFQRSLTKINRFYSRKADTVIINRDLRLPRYKNKSTWLLNRIFNARILRLQNSERAKIIHSRKRTIHTPLASNQATNSEWSPTHSCISELYRSTMHTMSSTKRTVKYGLGSVVIAKVLKNENESRVYLWNIMKISRKIKWKGVRWHRISSEN